MSTDTQLDKWQTFTDTLRANGIKSFALVAVDGMDNHVFWGADFGYQPEAILAKLQQIEHDIKDTIKRNKVSA